jgi:hypothetical protein
MAECKLEQNKENCNCTYTACTRTGLCCECVKYHRSNNQVPACFFSAGAEKAHNRSIANFIKDQN